MKFSDVKVGQRIRVLTITAIFGYLCIIGISLNQFQHELSADVETKTQQIVQSASSVLEHFEEGVTKGLYTREEAKEKASAVLARMRYGEKDYFFILDTNVQMIMHPIKPQLNNTDVSQVKDPNGKALFVEMVKVANEKGAGFVAYQWEKPGQSKPVDKISYAALFKPWGWIVGSGVYVDDVSGRVHAAMRQLLIPAALVILLAVLISSVVARSIARPLASLSATMSTIADGNLNVEVAGTERNDEIGGMAQALDQFRQQALDLKEAEKKAHALEEASRQQRREAMLAMAGQFEQMVGRVVGDLITVAEELQTSAEGMVKVAHSTKVKSGEVAQASVTSAQASSAVAAATEELSSAIREISQQTQNSSQVCNRAQESAHKLQHHMGALLEQANQVTQVTSFINNVASQINLLALNATIESARAGEAGRGFAVVAGEVKNLAGQTSNASDSISSQMQMIHEASTTAHESIAGIVTIIQEVFNSVSSIAAAVEEQSAATSEISANVNRSATSVDQVRGNIGEVEQGADNTSASASGILGSVQQLRDQSNELKSKVEEFLATVRSAA